MAVLDFTVGFIMIWVVLGENCDHLGVLLYEDIGCTPEYDKSNSCPIRYNCNSASKPEDKCFFRGRSYASREYIEDDLTSPLCAASCFCNVLPTLPLLLNESTSPTATLKRSAFIYGGDFTCAAFDCPEWLGHRIEPGCYRTYSVNHCCSTGHKCPPFADTHTCTVDGTKYMEGERFGPKDSCQRCTCQKGFNGKFEEPFCKRSACGVQIRRSAGADLRNGCAPLYGKKSESALCCPSSFICPDGTEKITGDIKRDDVCKFGSKSLKIGEGFEKQNFKTSFGQVIKKVACECIIPPLLTCNEM